MGRFGPPARDRPPWKRQLPADRSCDDHLVVGITLSTVAAAWRLPATTSFRSLGRRSRAVALLTFRRKASPWRSASSASPAWARCSCPIIRTGASKRVMHAALACAIDAAWERLLRGWIRATYLDAWVSMVVSRSRRWRSTSWERPRFMRKDCIRKARIWSSRCRGRSSTRSATGHNWRSGRSSGRLVQDVVSVECRQRGERGLYQPCWVPARSGCQPAGPRDPWVSILIPAIALGLFFPLRSRSGWSSSGERSGGNAPSDCCGHDLDFRYRRLDRRLTPSLVWDVCLWIASSRSMALVALDRPRADQILKVRGKHTLRISPVRVSDQPPTALAFRRLLGAEVIRRLLRVGLNMHNRIPYWLSMAWGWLDRHVAPPRLCSSCLATFALNKRPKASPSLSTARWVSCVTALKTQDRVFALLKITTDDITQGIKSGRPRKPATVSRCRWSRGEGRGGSPFLN